MKKVLVYLLLLVLLVSFFYSVEWQQKIKIEIQENNKLVSGLKVKLISGRSQDCSDNGVEGKTDNEGIFQATRKKSRGILDRFMVSVQHDTLCVLQNNNWLIIWSESYGPALDVISLKCELANSVQKNLHGSVSDVCDLVQAM